MAWTDEQKQSAIDTYTEGNPTPENSTELIKQIAEDMQLIVGHMLMQWLNGQRDSVATALQSTQDVKTA